jgi:hypothetical protein
MPTPIPVGEKPMTEDNWLACTDHNVMLECLQEKVSRRKLGLWVVACCRAAIAPGNNFLKAVDMVERYVHGEASEAELETMFQTYHSCLVLVHPPHYFSCNTASFQVATYTRGKLTGLTASLLRDIFGTMLFRPVSINHE